MKQMICSLVPNQDVKSYFLVVDAPQVRKSKRGTDYATLELVDASGKIDARLWEIPAALELKWLKRAIVKVEGQTSEWEGKLQVTISKIRLVCDDDHADMDLGDFFEASPFDPDTMWEELLHIVDMNIVNEKVLTLIRKVLLQNEANFKRAPAAKHVHHAYIGGLLEHVLDMCKVAIPICENYGLSTDLVLAGCVLHDIGKCFELTYDFGIGYSVSGSLIGHIGQGVMMVYEAIDKVDGFPQQMKVAIMHLILSHHGSTSWGSPRVPLMREAIALHLTDMLSSKMGICARVLKSGVDDEGFTEWCRELEGRLWQIEQ